MNDRLPDIRAARLARLRGLYAIADDSFASTPEALLSLVEAALRGGALVVQLRAKSLGASALLAVARAAQSRCHDAGALLFINDRPDVAVLAGADGVHLGQDDFPLIAARAIVGPDVLLGISTHSDAEIDAAVAAGADCIGFGPAFETSTKRATAPGAAALPPAHGIEGVRRAVLRAGVVPLIAIGGIDSARAEALAHAGAACIAAISSLWLAPDPAAMSRTFVSAIARGEEKARLGRGAEEAS